MSKPSPSPTELLGNAKTQSQAASKSISAPRVVTGVFADGTAFSRSFANEDMMTQWLATSQGTVGEITRII
jgi:hypothetical protein